MTVSNHTALCGEAPIATAASAAQWVHLVPTGHIKGRDGRAFVLDNAEAVITASLRGADLVIDYEHQTAQLAEAAPAAGWIKSLEARENGIWGLVEWTDRARAMIAAKEYRYVSPVIQYDPKSKVIRQLTGAGLVHKPNLALTALNAEGHAEASEALGMIACALGLNSQSDAGAIVAAISTMRAPDPARFMPIDAVQDLMKQASTASAELSQIEASRLVEAAMAEGHISPAMVPWATALCRQSPESFEAFCSASPRPFAHLSQLRQWPTKSGHEANGSGAACEIASALGLSPDALHKAP